MESVPRIGKDVVNGGTTGGQAGHEFGTFMDGKVMSPSV